jgi:hypothetical protein
MRTQPELSREDSSWASLPASRDSQAMLPVFACLSRRGGPPVQVIRIGYPRRTNLEDGCCLANLADGIETSGAGTQPSLRIRLDRFLQVVAASRCFPHDRVST